MNNRTYFESQKYEGLNYSVSQFVTGEYDYCEFINCDFTGVDLSNCEFTEVVFKTCNFSMVKLINTSFNDVDFFDCKLLGVDFEKCNPYIFSPKFTNCTLELTSFYKRALKKMIFDSCKINDCDFIEADLSGAAFNGCDLRLTKFENTILEKADFSTAVNYSINPEINKIKKAVFSLPDVLALLDKHDIIIR